MKKLLPVILLVCFQAARSQVVIQFIPELQGRTVDGLLMAKVASQMTEKKKDECSHRRSLGEVVPAFDRFGGLCPPKPSFGEAPSILE